MMVSEALVQVSDELGRAMRQFDHFYDGEKP